MTQRLKPGFRQRRSAILNLHGHRSSNGLECRRSNSGAHWDEAAHHQGVRGSFFALHPIGIRRQCSDQPRICRTSLRTIIASSVNTLFTCSGSRGDLPPVRWSLSPHLTTNAGGSHATCTGRPANLSPSFAPTRCVDASPWRTTGQPRLSGMSQRLSLHGWSSQVSGDTLPGVHR